jgi:hypothetical protein
MASVGSTLNPNPNPDGGTPSPFSDEVGGGGARPLPTAARHEDSMLQTGIFGFFTGNIYLSKNKYSSMWSGIFGLCSQEFSKSSIGHMCERR